MLYVFSLASTNSFPASFKSSLSVKSLWTCNNERKLKRLLFMVERNQVLSLLAVENDLSGVHDVAGLKSGATLRHVQYLA